ncbi:MAG: LytR C-terminal domain-containing protein [Candidatus Levybacteria bacterium]|nr:LytR C-terminal domain-containing protein [Candidatus Levybacteria bacterium]
MKKPASKKNTKTPKKVSQEKKPQKKVVKKVAKALVSSENIPSPVVEQAQENTQEVLTKDPQGVSQAAQGAPAPTAIANEPKEVKVEVLADNLGLLKPATDIVNQVPPSPVEPSASAGTETSGEASAEEPAATSTVISPETPAIKAAESSDATVSPTVPTVAPDAPLKVEEQSQEEVEEEPPLEKSNKKLFILGAIISLVVVIITMAFGIYLLQQASQDKSKEKKVVVEATPTPKVDLTLDRDDWTFEVLNGTSTPGKAANLAQELTKKGYSVIKTGNADTKDYEETEILIIDSKTNEETELVLEDIKDVVNKPTKSGDLVDGSASARIIIGSQE